MTRASYVTPGQTAARLDNIRRLVTALLTRSMRRDEISDLLQMGPSGVRKYLVDLGDRISIVRTADGPVYFIAMTPEQAQAFLVQLAQAPVSRPVGRPRLLADSAMVSPGRRIHLMKDDAHYAVRLHSAPAARDPLVAAFFGPRAAEVRA